ncbi:MAG: hypothetical protein K0R23_2368, partial [Lacrimispora sp.]|nr:hypothetical protein [Lacrimispora sp.]
SIILVSVSNYSISHIFLKNRTLRYILTLWEKKNTIILIMNLIRIYKLREV